MGMYTEFLIDCHLKGDAPESVKAALHLLVNERDLEAHRQGAPGPFATESARTPEGHAFFTDDRFEWLGNPQSYPEDASTMFGESAAWSFAGGHLRIGTDVKNYDDVLDKFWAWISPWIVEAEGTRIGWCQYEEYDNPSPVVVGQPLEYGEGLDL